MLLAARKMHVEEEDRAGQLSSCYAGHIDGIAVILYSKICTLMQRLTIKT